MPGGEDHDRNRRVLGAEPPADLHPVEVRQSEVEQDERGVVLGGERERLTTGRHPVDLVALRLERPLQRPPDRLVVLDHEDRCRRHPIRLRARRHARAPGDARFCRPLTERRLTGDSHAPTVRPRHTVLHAASSDPAAPCPHPCGRVSDPGPAPRQRCRGAGSGFATIGSGRRAADRPVSDPCSRRPRRPRWLRQAEHGPTTCGRRRHPRTR